MRSGLGGRHDGGGELMGLAGIGVIRRHDHTLSEIRIDLLLLAVERRSYDSASRGSSSRSRARSHEGRSSHHYVRSVLSISQIVT